MNFIQVNRYHDIVLDTNEMLKLEFLIKSFSCCFTQAQKIKFSDSIKIQSPEHLR